MSANIQSLEDTARRIPGLKSRMLYAMKVNRSISLLRTAIERMLGIDVSSTEELKLALANGACGPDCSVSGPFKSDELIALSIRSKACLSVDSLDELTDIVRIAKQIGKHASVSVRWNGDQAHTRFGMSLECTQKCALEAHENPDLEFQGFSFHLGGYSAKERGEALSKILMLSITLSARGIAVRQINIGGGLPVQYLEQEHWERYLFNVDKNNFYRGDIPSHYYPYWSAMSASETFEAIVHYSSNLNVLKHLNIELLIEPGRALVDDAGFTVFEVLGLKQTHAGEHCIVVKGLSFSACETWFGSEYMVDPVHVSSRTNPPNKAPLSAYIAGQSCLENDLITKRLVCFDHTPQKGDLLVFNNTAGYQMDLMESKFHHIQLPKKVTMLTGRGSFSDASDNEHALPWKLEDQE